VVFSHDFTIAGNPRDQVSAIRITPSVLGETRSRKRGGVAEDGTAGAAAPAALQANPFRRQRVASLGIVIQIEAAGGTALAAGGVARLCRRLGSRNGYGR